MRHATHMFHHVQKNRDDQHNTKDDGSMLETLPIDVDSVSDEEALLACRAYLMRKKRLPWNAGQERRRRRASKDLLSFWDDPHQLPFITSDILYSREVLLESNSTQFHDRELLDDDDEEDDDRDTAATALWESGQNPEETVTDWETVVNTPESIHDLVEEDDEMMLQDVSESDLVSEEFAAIDTFPSKSFLKRSSATKARWNDPEWKAEWYRRRWGSALRQNQTKKPTIANVNDLLQDPQLAALSPDEIAEAIRVYLSSKEKRRRSQLATREMQQKRILDGQPSLESISQDRREEKSKMGVLFEPDEDTLLAQKHKRSRRARLAYQTRLAKQETSMKQPTSALKPPCLSNDTNDSPHRALQNIQADLDNQRLPSYADVKICLQPARLAKRKEIFRRILNECFDLRGKCVPEWIVNDEPENPNETEFVFVTSCPMIGLGKFVLHKLSLGTQ